MPLPASRPSTRNDGYAYLSMAVACPLIGLAWLLGGSTTIATAWTSMTLVFGVVAVFAFRNATPAQTLTVQEGVVVLLEDDRVVGRIPLGNVETIKTIWDKAEPRKSVLGQLAALWADAQGHNSDPVPVGIIFRLHDRNDPATLWPGAGSPPRRDELYLSGTWDQPIKSVVEALRQAQIEFLREHGLLPEEPADTNPFDFT